MKHLSLGIALPLLALPVVGATDWCEVRDQPTGFIAPAASAGEASSPLCDGPCIVDIAFLYEPSAISGEGYCGIQYSYGCREFRRAPKSVGELGRYLEAVVAQATAIFERSGLDVEFRFVGLEPRGGSGERARHADLVYLVEDGDPSLDRDGWAGYIGRRLSDGGLGFPYPRVSSGSLTLDGGLRFTNSGYVVDHVDGSGGRLWRTEHAGYTLAHEIGHNLGLAHDPDQAAREGWHPEFRGAYGYRGKYCISPRIVSGGPCDEWYSTVMAYWGSQPFYRFSDATKSVYGRPIGQAGVSDAVSVLRRNLPYLANRVSTAPESPPDHGCEPRLCIGEAGRFLVKIAFLDPGSSVQPRVWWGNRLYNAEAEKLYSAIGDSAALFYFFEPHNPELLVKVLDGCGLNNRHWVFGSAATDLEYALLIRDLATGDDYVYEPTAGSVIADIDTIPCLTP